MVGGQSTKIGVMRTRTHYFSSSRFYELLVNTNITGDTSMDLKKFYNHINIFLNTVTRLLEDLLTSYHSIKSHPEFSEYFIPYRDHLSYYWNVQIYTSLVHSVLVAMTNDTCVKYFMAPQSYNFFSTHSHEISGWKILSRLLHLHSPHIGGMNGDVQYYLATLDFKNGEQLEDLI